MMTSHGICLDDTLICAKLNTLINQFFKILPLKESDEKTLVPYMSSLQRELLGLRDLIIELGADDSYLTLLSILEYLINNDCDVSIVRSEVFKSINIIKRIQLRYAKEGSG